MKPEDLAQEHVYGGVMQAATVVKVSMQLPTPEVLALQLLPIYLQSWVFANKSLNIEDVTKLSKLAKDSAVKALEEVVK